MSLNLTPPRKNSKAWGGGSGGSKPSGGKGKNQFSGGGPAGGRPARISEFLKMTCNMCFSGRPHGGRRAAERGNKRKGYSQRKITIN